MKKWASVITWLIGWLLMAFTGLAFQSEKDRTAQGIFNVHLENGRFALFLRNSTETDITPANFVVVIFNCLVHLSAEIHYAIILASFGISSMTMWVATSNFMDSVKRRNFEVQRDKEELIAIRKLSIRELREKYSELGILVDTINSVWSGLFFWLIFDLSLWLSTDLDRVLKSPDYYSMGTYVCLIVCFTIGLLFSAECSKMVRILNY